jgi:KDO2-lipid IV(A) lauroyltransferase
MPERTETSVALPDIEPGLAGRIIYNCLPIRRRTLLENLRTVYGEDAPPGRIRALAQAFYGHLARSLLECAVLPFLTARRKASLVRIENGEAVAEAAAERKGILILTGHFGNWEVAPLLGLARLPLYRGRFHFVRRPIRARWIERLVTRRFLSAGIHVIPKKGSLEMILERLASGDIVVFILDQHAAPKDGVEVEFFGRKASTLRSLAVIALATGAPVVPAACFREPGGGHVLRFEDPLPPADAQDADEAIRASTLEYNRALEKLIVRHPEQWFWIHRRWKEESLRPRRSRRKRLAARDRLS